MVLITEWLHPDMLDGGLNAVKTACTSIAMVDYAYAVGDSYAAVRGTADVNIIAEKTGLSSTDFTIAASGTYNRKVTVGDKSTTVAKTSSGTANQLRFAWFDTVNSKVLAIVRVSTAQTAYIGNPFTIKSHSLISTQPPGVTV